jgi:hypothetical protein
MAHRRLDVVLDSVKRLLRVGATANLVNLQKQHPADLAQVFSELTDKDRQSAFTVLVERNGRLAMEALSELGPEGRAALLAGRSAEEIGKLLLELPSDDAARDHRLPARGRVGHRPRVDAGCGDSCVASRSRSTDVLAASRATASRRLPRHEPRPNG